MLPAPLRSALLLALILALFAAACGPEDGTGDFEDVSGAQDVIEEGIEEGDGGDAPPLEPVELGVLTTMTRLDAPARIAFAPDGTRFLALADGRILRSAGGSTSSVARVAGTLRGLAVDPAFPDRPYLYVLLERDEDAMRVHQITIDGDDFVGSEVLAEVPTTTGWRNNALAFDANGTLYAALGDAEQARASVDLETLVARLLEEDGAATAGLVQGTLPCDPASPVPGSDIGPWVALGGGTSPASTNPGIHLRLASLWTLDGAVAMTPYEDTRIPQWHGSLFVVTEDGHLLRVPRDEDSACLDFAASEVLYAGAYGRLSDVAQGPEGDLYLVTANGPRGTHPYDDRLLRIAPVEALDLLYPDLRTQPPANLALDLAWVGDERRPVLRFTNTVMNLGQGPLEIWSYDNEIVVQRVYTEDGSYLERVTGEVVYHWSHAHFHFNSFNRFELWEREDYERMLDGDEDVEPIWLEDKVSMCLMDLIPVAQGLPGTPEWGDYSSACTQGAQGISVGWGDIYPFDIPEQWVAIDGQLRDADYVLRSIVDSENLFHESPGGSDPDRESHHANGATTWFTVSGGRITVTHTDSGAGDDWS